MSKRSTRSDTSESGAEDDSIISRDLVDTKKLKKKLGKEKWAKIEEAFAAMDVEKTGVLRGESMQNALVIIQGSASGAEAQTLLNVLDKDRNGEVTFGEFVNMLVEGEKMQLRELRDAFEVFDTDNSGHIAEKELSEVLKSIGIKMDTDLKKMLRDADQNDDGTVSFKEFCRILGYQNNLELLSDEDEGEEHASEEYSVPSAIIELPKGCCARSGPSKRAKIHVELFYQHEEVTVHADPSMTVKAFREICADKFGLPAERLRLYYEGFHMPAVDIKDLHSYDVDFGQHYVFVVLLPNPERLPHDECFAADGKPNPENILKHFLYEGHIEKVDALKILKDVKKVLRAEANLVKLDDPATVVGDIHGQLFDVAKIFEAGGGVEERQYLFLGDYVDRGAFSMEVVLYLLALKLRHPNNVFLLRGNHESQKCTKRYGTMAECKSKYSNKVYKELISVFQYLPLYGLVTSVGKRFVCCHGGMSDKILLLEHIEGIQRIGEAPAEGPLKNVLWGDPYTDCESNKKLPLTWDLGKLKKRKDKDKGKIPTELDEDDFHASERGEDVRVFGYDALKTFLKANNLVSMFRAHEVKDPGYEYYKFGPDWEFPGCVTVFSAPNYTDDFANDGCVACFDEGQLEFRQYKWNLHPQYRTFEPMTKKQAKKKQKEEEAKGRKWGAPGSKDLGREDFVQFINYVYPDALRTMTVDAIEEEFIETFVTDKGLRRSGQSNHWHVIRRNLMDVLRLSQDPKVRRRVRKKSHAMVDWYKGVDMFSEALEKERPYEMDFKDASESKTNSGFDEEVLKKYSSSGSATATSDG